MATACLTGFPALTSAPMFFLKAFLLNDFTNGIYPILAYGFWRIYEMQQPLEHLLCQAFAFSRRFPQRFFDA